ncbi:MAG: hypothetical protein ACXABY_10620 [Candidatus Thorarchaeota archaeon]|jgi:hypothetical protein
MTYVNTIRAGRKWTATEDARLHSSYPIRTYATIANSKFFKGKRSLKAIRRRMERSAFGY